MKEPTLDTHLNDGERNNIEQAFDAGPARKKQNIQQVFAEHPELTLIGTQEQYLEYLSTIFPESKCQEILWHGTPFELKDEVFSKDVKRSQQSSYIGAEEFHGFWFSGSKDRVTRYKNDITSIESQEKDLADFIEKNKGDIGKEMYTTQDGSFGGEEVYYSVIEHKKKWIEKTKERIGDRTFAPQYYAVVTDMRNPRFQDISNNQFEFGENDSIMPLHANDNDYDGSGYYVVSKPQQIHILGRKADRKKFEQFVTGNKHRETANRIPEDLKKAYVLDIRGIVKNRVRNENNYAFPIDECEANPDVVWDLVTDADIENLLNTYQQNRTRQLLEWEQSNKVEGEFNPETGRFTSSDVSYIDKKIEDVTVIKSLLQ